ncbi:membrane protein [Dokdonia pacifica]|uniref:Outer membrane protein OmpA n=1 Tax=Dokdonia pacifica TaxID=1627892 RepID=A0A238WEP6_9FLAO|nr:OmpA family protein [Dokdonia pacifica]GGG20657.1 membrane protein [Dokdonia pacifica]SNR44918.1 Outer membrane protein OmpA [Dokdonia pacifica]
MISIAQVDRSHETFFDTDQYDITPIETAKLNRFIASLPKDKIEDISIYGYCDDRGSDAYNNKLSQQRADAIKAIFSEQGISDTIIKNSDGKGELLLTRLDDITNEVQRKLNRKVEIIVSIKQPRVISQEEEESEKELTAAVEEKRYKSFSDTITKGDRILLENILFKINYSYIKSSSYKSLRELAKFLKENDNIIFKIQGHVCCVGRGRDAIDLKTGKRNLSVSRAKFVYDYLSKNGVSKKRMRYEGFGSRYPLGGDTKLDRRVEILVTYVKKKKKKK